MRKIPLLLLVGALLFGIAAPAQAATFSFSDPEGDATGLHFVESTPLPSEPGYDITKVSISFDGKDLRYVVKLKALPADGPTLSTGYYFRLYFTYAGAGYQFQVGQSKVGGSGTYFVANGDATRKSLTCSGCRGVIDHKTSTVSVTAPLKSINQGMKQHNSSTKPAAPGSKFATLRVLAQRDLVLLTPTSDSATAPENSTFTL